MRELPKVMSTSSFIRGKKNEKKNQIFEENRVGWFSITGNKVSIPLFLYLCMT